MLKICNFICDYLTKFMVVMAIVFCSSFLAEGDLQSYLILVYQLMIATTICSCVFMLIVLLYNVLRISEDPANDRRF